MEKKQTALNWLIEVLNLKGYEQTLNKAKEMEKIQITDAYHAGIEDFIPYNYYDNTFKSESHELKYPELYYQAIAFGEWIIEKQITFIDDTTSGTLYHYNGMVVTMEKLFNHYLVNIYESNDKL